MQDTVLTTKKIFLDCEVFLYVRYCLSSKQGYKQKNEKKNLLRIKKNIFAQKW